MHHIFCCLYLQQEENSGGLCRVFSYGKINCINTYFNVGKTEITVCIAFSIHHHVLYQYITKKASIPWNSQLLVKFWVVNERKKRVDVADKINEDIFIAAQIKDCRPEVLQTPTPVKAFVIHMGTIEIMLHGSRQNLANAQENKYLGLWQKENLPLSTCNRFCS